MGKKTKTKINPPDLGSNSSATHKDPAETRSTREQIVAHLKAIDHKPPPPSMSNEELEAIVATGDYEKAELNPTPGEESVRELPPSDVDMPKHVQIGMAERDRNFWFNIVIGCSGPDATSNTVIRSNGFRSRNAAKLAYAMADVERLRGFVNNTFTEPELVMPIGTRALAGTFAETIYLREPGEADLNRAFVAMRSFFERNKDDPEWMGGQVNIFFAGHGTNDHTEDPINRGGFCLKDKVVGPRELQERLIDALPATGLEQWYGFSSYGNCRVDMYLDCCYSGQFAAAFIGRLLKDRRGLVPGKFWCSSMPFQESFESDKLQHGIFTAFFLNDFSTKAARSSVSSLRAGDVGKQTKNRQTPFMVDFSRDRGPLPIVPGAVGMNWIADNQVPLTRATFEDGNAFANWLTEFLNAVYFKNWKY